jgi:hypothetical protein
MNYREPSPGELLAALKRQDSPSEADQERIRSRVLATLGTAALGVGAAGLASKAAAAAPKTVLALGPLGKLSLVVGLISTGAVFTVQHWNSTREAPRAATYVTAPGASGVPAAGAVSAGPVLEAAPPVDAAQGVQVEQAVQQSPSAVAAEAPPALPNGKAARPRLSSENLDAEVSLLRAAQQALQGGRYPEALAKLSEHAQRFPRGLLRDEREASRAIALCQGGQSSSGQSRARDYLRTNAQSPLAARVQSACKLD